MPRFAVIVLLGVCILAGCKETPQQTAVQVAVVGDPNVQLAFEELIRQNPAIIDPQSGNKFFIIPVEPRPDVDYKIIAVKPDPDIDYKIMIAGPKSANQMQALSRQLEEAIRKQLRQHRDKHKPQEHQK